MGSSALLLFGLGYACIAGSQRILMVAMDKRRLPMVYGWPPHVFVTLEQGEPVSRPRDVRDIRLCS